MVQDSNFVFGVPVSDPGGTNALALFSFNFPYPKCMLDCTVVVLL